MCIRDRPGAPQEAPSARRCCLRLGSLGSALSAHPPWMPRFAAPAGQGLVPSPIVFPALRWRANARLGSVPLTASA
eukprot:13371416-Alexandrium_andersonii.AAC.1